MTPSEKAAKVEAAARGLLALNDAERAQCFADINAEGPPMNDDGTPYVCDQCKTGAERDAPLRAALNLSVEETTSPVPPES